MMIESDMLFAHVKETDWLKETADRLMLAIDKGALGTVYASRESIHELYYLSAKVGWKPREALSKIGSLTQIRNLSFPPTTTDIDLLALSLLATYDLTSIFDAYHAACCLIYDPERQIISKDQVYDKIKNLNRVEPETIVANLGKGKAQKVMK